MNTLRIGISLFLSLHSLRASHAAAGNQVLKLEAEDAAARDRFGWSVGTDGGTAIVGAYRDDDRGSDSGSAYLFDVASGNQLLKLTAEDGGEDALFGVSIAISGRTAIVGARFDGDNGYDSGSAYLFDVATGNQLAKLIPDEGAANHWFGASVAITSGAAIVGTRTGEAAYVFKVPEPGNELLALFACCIAGMRRRERGTAQIRVNMHAKHVAVLSA